MGIYSEFFAAPSDSEAATALESGPAGRFDTLEPVRVMPPVETDTLEALLTGRSYDEVAAEDDLDAVAVLNDGDAMVLPLMSSFRTALATADDAALVAVSDPWARSEEFGGRATGEDALPFLRALAALAKRAEARSEQLYCWVTL